MVHAIRHIANATVEARVLRKMKVVRIGAVCAEECSYCGQEPPLSQDEKKNMGSVEHVLATIGPGDRVIFTGGGLSRCDALPEWVARAKKSGAKQVLLQANGTALAYGGFVDALRGAGADVFAISLHGAIAPMHEWVSQARGSFMETVRGIQNVRKAGGTVLVNSVITRSNFRHVGELVSLSAKLGVRMVRLLWPFEAGVPHKELLSITPVPDVVRPYISRAEEHAIRVGLRLHVELPGADEVQKSAQPPETE